MEDYSVDKHVVKRSLNYADSKLAPSVIDLMDMLFDVETYRSLLSWKNCLKTGYFMPDDLLLLQGCYDGIPN